MGASDHEPAGSPSGAGGRVDGSARPLGANQLLRFSIGLLLILNAAVFGHWAQTRERRAIAEESHVLWQDLRDLRRCIGQCGASHEWRRVGERLEPKLEVIVALQATKQRPARVLGAVSQAMPTGATITGLQLNDADLVLEGRADDPIALLDLGSSLAVSGCFESVQRRQIGSSGPGGALTFRIDAVVDLSDCPITSSPARDAFRPSSTAAPASPTAPGG